MTTRAGLDDAAITSLRAGFRGPLLRPGEAGYDAARRVDNAMIDRRPALIARCAGVADVLAAVRFARERDVVVSVRGGGHNVAGNAVCDGGLMIDLSPMKGVRVDPVARTARAAPGVTWGEFDHETQAFGLATTGGVISTTGIAGLTLGGGVGWLNGRFGLACDNLVGADVVTADGRLLRASEAEHADLFWALRGGGGNFGIVTSFEYRLHEVGPVVLAGPVFHPAQRAREVLRFYREFVATEPDELTTYAGLLTGPDGTPLVGMVPVYAGPPERGAALVEPLRKFGPPLVDQVGPMPYLAVQQMFDPAFPPGRYNYWKSSLAPRVSDALIDAILEHMARVPSPHSAVMLEHYHGAYARRRPDETAYRHRAPVFDVVIIANWTDPADTEKNVAWARSLFQAVQPQVSPDNYVNFLGADEGADRVRAAYGANYDRLAALKRTYDPTNFFRMNQNIRPA
ncbi:MAG TPA: FAD-binding oxidoreductase [Candidatus Tectomicrobia bacterium]|nr:FAD-binding oxidoreductase [Candidatus Tectomicrobia bacterium]